MGKKNRFVYEDYDDDDLVIDKKTKRRMERAARAREEQQRREDARLAEENPEEAQRNDLMSQIAVLCQEHRWREALVMGRKAVLQAAAEGQEMSPMPLQVLTKIDKSMRRQMAATFLSLSKELLKKEYLPDVGE